MKQSRRWFEDWFNTPFYHVLYRDRDKNEAQLLIKNLLHKLQPAFTAHFLDLACGRGRHAIFLNSLGHKVTGLDLSESNIAYAKTYESERLHFVQADMRQPYGENNFDYIFNLFTSFGYFSNWEENQQAANCMAKALKPDGTLVLDFMNVNKISLGLVKEEQRQVGDILFKINRSIGEDRVIKSIHFHHHGLDYAFEEKVQLFTLADFEQLFKAAGLCIKETYGDFDLSPFDARNSERLLLFAQHSS
jgi:SAM-dependent methyltransferase